jgi:hypothetical protein
MSKIELLNKKILDNLKMVAPVGGSLDSYVNGGGRPPNHALVDRNHVAEIKSEQLIDQNTDKKDPDV